MDIKIRKVDSCIIAKLDEESKKRNLSREALLKSLLQTWSLAPELHEQEEKYSNLVKMIGDILQANTFSIKELEKAISSNLVYKEHEVKNLW